MGRKFTHETAKAERKRKKEQRRQQQKFPTYAGILGRVAANAARQLNSAVDWQNEAEG